MSSVQPCYDTSDIEIFSKTYNFFLKPIARLHISVQLPPLRANGKSISNWEIMEKIRSLSRPDEFTYMKVVKSSLEFVRLEAELESRHQIKGVMAKLEQRTIKLSGHPEALKMRACEAKTNFPSKHDWDSFFRDARNMNEMKPGERPDTVHLNLLPTRWFSKSSRTHSLPSESILKDVFETFGPLRCIDVPTLDPYSSRILALTKKETRSFPFDQETHFEAFIQYQEYIGFVRCMTALKGMKLLYKEEDKAWTASIQVDFDKSKHLSESSIKRRHLIREKLIQEDLEKEREEKRRQELKELKKEADRRRLEEEREKQREEERRKQKEKKRKKRELRKLKLESKLQKSIAIEERKLLITQRKLESIRLLDFLLERVKVEVQKEEAKKKEEELLKELEKMQKKKSTKERKKAEKEKKAQLSLEEKEKEIRSRLIKKYTKLEEKRMEEQRENLRKAMENSSVKLKSVVTTAQSAGKIHSGFSTTDEVTLSEDSADDNAVKNRSYEERKSRFRSRSPHRSQDWHSRKDSDRWKSSRNYRKEGNNVHSRSYRSLYDDSEGPSRSDYYSMYDRYFSRIAEKSRNGTSQVQNRATLTKPVSPTGRVRISSTIKRVPK